MNNKGMNDYKHRQELINFEKIYKKIIHIIPALILIALAVTHIFLTKILEFEIFVIVTLVLVVVVIEFLIHEIQRLQSAVKTTGQLIKSTENSIIENIRSSVDILDRTIPIKELQNKEEHVEKTVCIFLATTKYEEKIFSEVIIKNVDRNVKYTYYVSDEIVKGHILRFIHCLKSKYSINPDKIINNITIIPMKQSEMFGNLTLYDRGLKFDPNKSERDKIDGYLLPNFGNPEKAFLVRLDPELYNIVSEKMDEWKNDPSNKPIDLTTYLK